MIKNVVSKSDPQVVMAAVTFQNVSQLPYSLRHSLPLTLSGPSPAFEYYSGERQTILLIKERRLEHERVNWWKTSVTLTFPLQTFFLIYGHQQADF